MTKNDKHRIEVADWSPIKMLWQRFDAACGHLAMFFGDECGGREIGVKLKPEKALSGLQVRTYPFSYVMSHRRDSYQKISFTKNAIPIGVRNYLVHYVLTNTTVIICLKLMSF